MSRVEGLHFHDLRGSGATWAATAGTTVRELMARLGHKTERMAIRYQHATLERDQAIADKLGALMRAVEASAPSTNLVPIKRESSGSSDFSGECHKRNSALDATSPLSCPGAGVTHLRIWG